MAPAIWLSQVGFRLIPQSRKFDSVVSFGLVRAHECSSLWRGTPGNPMEHPHMNKLGLIYVESFIVHICHGGDSLEGVQRTNRLRIEAGNTCRKVQSRT